MNNKASRNFQGGEGSWGWQSSRERGSAGRAGSLGQDSTVQAEEHQPGEQRERDPESLGQAMAAAFRSTWGCVWPGKISLRTARWLWPRGERSITVTVRTEAEVG